MDDNSDERKNELLRRAGRSSFTMAISGYSVLLGLMPMVVAVVFGPLFFAFMAVVIFFLITALFRALTHYESAKLELEKYKVFI